MLIDADARLLTPREAARWLKIAPQTVVRMARRGDLPGRRVGRRWRFLQAEIRQWLLVRGGS